MKIALPTQNYDIIVEPDSEALSKNSLNSSLVLQKLLKQGKVSFRGFKLVLRSNLRNKTKKSREKSDIENALIYRFANCDLNTATHQLTVRNNSLFTLSSAEYRLLLVLVTRPRRVLTRDQLLELTHDDETCCFDRSVDVLISRLRKKIEVDRRYPNMIKTIRNAGYMFDSTVTKQQVDV